MTSGNYANTKGVLKMVRTLLSRYMSYKSCKCTIKQLSEFTDIPESTLVEYMYNKREMTLTDFVTITDALGISPEKFIDRKKHSGYPPNNIRCIRTEHQMIQKDIAEKLGVWQTNISSLENYLYSQVSSYLLGDIASLFGLSVDYILGYIPEKIEINTEIKPAYNDKFFNGDNTSVKRLIGYAELQKKSLDEIFGFKRKGDNVTEDDENKTKRITEKQ